MRDDFTYRFATFTGPDSLRTLYGIVWRREMFYDKDSLPCHTIDGVVSRNPAVKDPLLSPFEQKCAGRVKELQAACRMAGGVELQAGDAACEFEAFPQVHLRLVFWDQDEDFPAKAQILVDQCVTDFVHL